MDNKQNALNITLDELTNKIKEFGLKSYIATQIFEWLYKKHITNFSQMTNISQKNRVLLENKFYLVCLRQTEKFVSKDGLAIKYRFKLLDDNEIESVVLQEKNYYSLCISSQVGCSCGCKFCVTGIQGFKRNLTTAEIIGQVLFAFQEGYNISRIVFMGMGEPLLNLDNVLTAITILTSPKGYNISNRKITVSTVGIISSLKRLLDDRIVLNLALSIGSANPIKRAFLMPIEKTNPLLQVTNYLSQYQKSHNRKLTIEYTVIKDQNDSDQDIREVVNLAKFLKAKINLINLNSHPKISFIPVSEKKLISIKNEIKRNGVIVTIRAKKGEDIFSACGQLG